MNWIVRIGRKDDPEGYRYATTGREWNGGAHNRMEAQTFHTYEEACAEAAINTWGEAVPETLLPVGTQVVVKLADAEVTGVISGDTTIYSNAYKGDRKEKLVYVVGLDVPFEDPFQGEMLYILAQPINVVRNE